MLTLVESAKPRGFRMTAQTVITLLLLVFCGAFGCAPTTVPLRANQAIFARELPKPAADENPAPVSHKPSEPEALDTPPLALAEQRDIEEETRPPPVSKTVIDTTKRTPAKPTKIDDAPKAAPVLSPDDSTALQKTPGPRADNRLLDLLEKDID